MTMHQSSARDGAPRTRAQIALAIADHLPTLRTGAQAPSVSSTPIERSISTVRHASTRRPTRKRGSRRRDTARTTSVAVWAMRSHRCESSRRRSRWTSSRNCSGPPRRRLRERSRERRVRPCGGRRVARLDVRDARGGGPGDPGRCRTATARRDGHLRPCGGRRHHREGPQGTRPPGAKHSGGVAVPRAANAAGQGDDFLAAVTWTVRQVVPEAVEIWLHGSRARGDAKRTSDWDFIVVVPADTPTSRLIDLGARGGVLDVGMISGRRVDIQAERYAEEARVCSVLYYAKREGRRIFPRPPAGP